MKTVLFFTFLALASFVQAQDKIVERFGIFIGANDGGNERTKLQWAVNDAARVSNVFMDIGGLLNSNAYLLNQPKIADIKSGFSKIKSAINQIKTSGNRIELIFYYSGHSDEFGLRLASEKLSYSDLKKSITEIGADVTIAILDSCSSGAFTRQKGGVRTQPFLVDSANETKGYAFLTSSSEDEASQESDAIGASFFTHFLTSGLRGAADSSGDGRITLNEAYYYAFNQTLARTENTKSGPQHANFDIKLSGAGDLVLSDTSKTNSSIVFNSKLEGSFFIRDSKNNLVAELDKKLGKPFSLAVKGGTYSIRNEKNGLVYEASVALENGRNLEIDESTFNSKKAQVHRIRGEEKTETENDGESDLLDQILKDLNTAITNGAEINLDLSNVLKVDGIIDPEDEVSEPEDSESDKIDETGPTLGLDLGFLELSALPSNSGKLAGIGIDIIGNTYNDKAYGLTISSIYTTVKGEFYGLSIAGITSEIYDLAYGLQISSIVNIAKKRIVGGQIGLINIAQDKVVGFQIGLLNFAKSVDGLSLGLISFIQDGVHEFTVVQDSLRNEFLVNFANGSRNLYSEVGLGWEWAANRFEGDAVSFQLKGGGGFRIPLDFINIDLVGGARFYFNTDQSPVQSKEIIPYAGIKAGWKILDNFAFSFGVRADFVSSEYEAAYLKYVKEAPLSQDFNGVKGFLSFEYGISLRL